MTPATLRARLDDLGIEGQAAVAEALGVTQPTVSLWLNGKSRIPAMVSLALKAIPKRKRKAAK